MSRIIERVSRGVALLDEKIPDWRSKIDIDDLVMSSCVFCVLGQIGGYRWTAGVLFGEHNEGSRLQAAHGFWPETLVVGEDTSQWKAEIRDLEAEWKSQIIGRRIANV